MAMIERASFEEAQSFETRRMQVLDGSAVRNRANARRGMWAKTSLIVIAVLVYMLISVFLSAKISIVGAEINSINGDIIETQEKAARLDLTIGALSSNERIESYAVSYLNMVYPSADSVYYLNEDTSSAILNGCRELEREEVQPEAAEEKVGLLAGIDAYLDGFFHGKTESAEEED